ncbi:Vam6/Vps39-like protein [Melipona quadrifasciata]|uniref:Vam6/Vps39-like protein n=1 Tax=Melipona quadrifasciata TaxID=166423 RepID=A0A0M8ZY92_9HYME|nr:Vam6/Vps39-like protein [Melipona quadrifasciata]
MHDAYEETSILNISVQIESMAAYDDNLLIGTREGHLLMYNVPSVSDDNHKLELLRHSKNFNKKRITQIDVVSEYNLLIILTDNIICIHDLNSPNFQQLYQLQKTRGATLFALDIKNETVNAEKETVVHLCVAVKRKLQLYSSKGKKFEAFNGIELTVPDIPRELIQHNPIKWTDTPSAIAWDDPYLLGIVHDRLEVYTIEGCLHIQTIKDLNKARLIYRCKQGKVFVASISHVWCVRAVDLTHQIRTLLEQTQFQLAIKLTSLLDISEEEKQKQIYKIQTLYAHHLFHSKRFQEAMDQFLKIGTDPYEVIMLFPDLVTPSSNNPEVNDPTLPKLQDREKSLRALIIFLTEVRHKLMRDAKPKDKENSEEKSLVDGKKNMTAVATEQLLKIIDTTLLKCYLQTTDALVAPLLRLNHCHLAEAEKTLLMHQKYHEFIILYQTKGQHRKALELLEKHAKENDSSLKGTARTIQYLQQLGKDHMDLILKFASWVLNEDPEQGLRIFLEDMQQVEQLPRPKVLDYLLRCHKDLVITYLEHVVYVWVDTNPLFHNVLIHQYKEKCLACMSKNATPAEKQTAQHIRQKLQQFLEKSTRYTPETILVHFPFDNLLEERAIILERLGRHQQAISIYISLLNDIPKAIEYCYNVYTRYQNQENVDKQKQSDGADEVYVMLIQQLLKPDNGVLTTGCSPKIQRTAQPDLEMALELLEKHASKINPLKTLEVIPDTVPIGRIKHFLEVSLQEKLNARRRIQVLRSLLYAEHLQVQEQRMHYESQSVLMTEFNICPVCKKRFGNQSHVLSCSMRSVRKPLRGLGNLFRRWKTPNRLGYLRHLLERRVTTHRLPLKSPAEYLHTGSGDRFGGIKQAAGCYSSRLNVIQNNQEGFSIHSSHNHKSTYQVVPFCDCRTQETNSQAVVRAALTGEEKVMELFFLVKVKAKA